MSKSIGFPQSPLTPFLGTWLLDPLSVSRNKVVKRILGEDGLKKLWNCESILERQRCLDADPDLAQNYHALLEIGSPRHLVVTPQTLTWNRLQSAALPAETAVYPVMRVTSEGKKLIVRSVDTRPGARGLPIGYVLRMSKQWLLVSERYEGRAAQLLPRSPVFRYSPMS
jgi:hypothetical protein